MLSWSKIQKKSEYPFIMLWTFSAQNYIEILYSAENYPSSSLQHLYQLSQ